MATETSARATIPMLDLQGEVEELWAEIMDAIQRVLRSGQFVLGPEVEAFEHEVAAFLGVDHAVAVNSGTDALVLGLRAAGVGPGDEVITTPFTFYATVEAILLVGATPVFVDIAEAGFNLDVAAVSGAVSDRTKAVVPVHVFGEPVAMAPLLPIAKEHGLVVLEDGAQAFGAWHAPKFDGAPSGRPRTRVGSLGDIAAFSLYPTKNLGAYGDGGVVVTNDAEVAASARSLRNHASANGMRYVHEGVGYNSRLDALQAAILRVKLPHVDRWNDLRRAVARRYDSALEAVPSVRTPFPSEGHVYHQYTIRVGHGRRDAVREELARAGIATSLFYPPPWTAWPAEARPSRDRLPRADRATADVLSLPLHPRLARAEQDRIIDAVREASQAG